MNDSGTAATTGHRTGTTRRRLAVAAGLLLGLPALVWLLRLPPGDPAFVAGASATGLLWAGAALAAGPLPRHGLGLRPGLLGLATGAAALGGCLAAGAAVAGIPWLREPAEALLAQGEAMVLPVAVLVTAGNGVAEEMFFRGALWEALPRAAALPVTTIIYTGTAVGSGVWLLVAGAAFLGLLTGWLRAATGGLLAPILAHLTWSVGMLLLLPPVLATGR